MPTSRSRRLYWSCAALSIAIGIALRWNALGGSLFADDWDHYAMEAGIYPVARGPLDLYTFVGKGAEERRLLKQSGRLPWWTAPDLELAVFRPLSSALLHLDYAVLGATKQPRHAHLHSMAWWAALVSGVAVLLARLVPLPVAALAVLLYALDEAHSLPVVWTANRSELVAATFVVWGLCAYLAARDRAVPVFRVLAVVLVGLGMLAGEHALAPLAYFVAFEVAGSEAPIARRIRSLAPFAALTVVYLAARTALGYGLAGSTFYVDPLRDPFRYAVACISRIPLLLGDLAFGYAAEWSYWEPPWRRFWLDHRLLPADWLTLARLDGVQHVAGLAAVVAVVAALVAWRRAAPNDPRQNLRWLLLGSALALVPVSGTLPMSRLTVAAAVGFDAALAWLLWRLLRRIWAGRRVVERGAALGLASLLVAVHVVYAAVRGRDEVTFYALRSVVEESWFLTARLEPDGLAQQHVMILSVRVLASHWALPCIRHRHGLGMPKSTQILTAAIDRPHRLVRVAPRVLDVLLPPPGPLGATFRVSPYRPDTVPFRAGDRFEGSDFQAEIVASDAGEPTHLRLIFRAPLEDASYVFLYPMPTGFERLKLPDVGRSLDLPPPSWPSFVPLRGSE